MMNANKNEDDGENDKDTTTADTITADTTTADSASAAEKRRSEMMSILIDSSPAESDPPVM